MTFDPLALFSDLEPISEEKVEGASDPVAGVYLLLHGGTVVYVGQSSNLRLRLTQHQRKIHDSKKLYHVPSNLSRRLQIETVLIALYAPKYNRAIMVGLNDGRFWEIRYGRR